MSKEVRKVLRRAIDLGLEVRRGNNGHWQCRTPGGGIVCVVPATPSDHRFERNAMADLRRYERGKEKGGGDQTRGRNPPRNPNRVEDMAAPVCDSTPKGLT